MQKRQIVDVFKTALENISTIKEASVFVEVDKLKGYVAKIDITLWQKMDKTSVRELLDETLGAFTVKYELDTKREF